MPTVTKEMTGQEWLKACVDEAMNNYNAEKPGTAIFGFIHNVRKHPATAHIAPTDSNEQRLADRLWKAHYAGRTEFERTLRSITVNE